MKPKLEVVRVAEGASFLAFERSEARFDFEWHHHPEYELTLITRGRGRRFAGDHLADYGRGDLVLLGPYLPHTWCSDPPRRGQRQQAFVIQFNPQWWQATVGNLPELAAVNALLGKSQRGLQFTAHTANRVSQTMADLVTCRGVDRVTRLLALLDTLSRSRWRYLAGQRYAADAPRPDARLNRIFNHLNAHLHEPIQQQQVASLVHMSTAAFSRFFKRATGRTFVHYLQELRISEACRRLIDTDQAVTDICFDSGFGNLSNFHRVFRQFKGCTPRTYRAIYRQRNAD